MPLPAGNGMTEDNGVSIPAQALPSDEHSIVGAGLAPALLPVTGLAPALIPISGLAPALLQTSMGNERFSPREELIALADEWIAAANDEGEKKTLLATREELLAALDLPGDHQGRHYISLDM